MGWGAHRWAMSQDRSALHTAVFDDVWGALVTCLHRQLVRSPEGRPRGLLRPWQYAICHFLSTETLDHYQEGIKMIRNPSGNLFVRYSLLPCFPFPSYLEALGPILEPIWQLVHRFPASVGAGAVSPQCAGKGRGKGMYYYIGCVPSPI